MFARVIRENLILSKYNKQRAFRRVNNLPHHAAFKSTQCHYKWVAGECQYVTPLLAIVPVQSQTCTVASLNTQPAAVALWRQNYDCLL